MMDQIITDLDTAPLRFLHTGVGVFVNDPKARQKRKTGRLDSSDVAHEGLPLLPPEWRMPPPITEQTQELKQVPTIEPPRKEDPVREAPPVDRIQRQNIAPVLQARPQLQQQQQAAPYRPTVEEAPYEQEATPSTLGWLIRTWCAHVVDICIVGASLVLCMHILSWTFASIASPGTFFYKFDPMRTILRLTIVEASVSVYGFFIIYWGLFKLTLGSTLGGWLFHRDF